MPLSLRGVLLGGHDADRLIQVTFGMMISGTLPWVRGLLLFPAQILGGIVAAALVSCLFPGPLAVETTLSNGTSIAQGVFIEMFLTAELVITILMLAAEKTRATFIAPIGIGLALFVAELTGWSLHQPRQLGDEALMSSFRCIFYRRLFESRTVVRAFRR